MNGSFGLETDSFRVERPISFVPLYIGLCDCKMDEVSQNLEDVYDSFLGLFLVNGLANMTTWAAVKWGYPVSVVLLQNLNG